MPSIQSMVTREEFAAYVAVQESGVTNMWDTNTVSDLSGLDINKVRLIMKNYGKLVEAYAV